MWSAQWSAQSFFPFSFHDIYLRSPYPLRMNYSERNSAIVQIAQPKMALLTVLAAIVAGLGSCAPNSSSSSLSEVGDTVGQTIPTRSETLKIVTTTIPVTDFTKAVVGDRAEVTYLLPTNVGPHDFQAKPDDVRTIADADVLVQNGLELESYLDDLIANANNPDLKTIDSSQGIEPLTGQEEHAEEEHAEGHEHGEFDPHIWLDPKRAIQQVENIRDGLIAADPDGEAAYTANAAAYIEQLKALDAEIAETLQPYTGEEFITYHDFAFYFADSYGLKAEYLVGMPDENPSPEDVKRVLETAQTENLKVLLTEPQAGDGQFAALAGDLDVQVSNFDPMETSAPQGVEPDYYLQTMRKNVESLEAAFEQSQP